MKPQSSLSVLIPNYNHALCLPESLGAILSQSYCPLEIIVADDASTDNSIEVLESFAKKYKIIRIVKNKRNLGAVGNANKLLELAKGKYVYFASADDRVIPGFFEQSIKMLEQYPHAGLCSGLAQLMNESGIDKGLYRSRIISAKSSFFPPDQCLKMLQKHGNWMVGCTLIFQRQALLDANGFIADLGPYVDGFSQQVVALRLGACFIPKPLAYWRRTESGYSVTQGRDIEMHLKRIDSMINLMSTTYRELFPYEYIKKYEYECLFGVGVEVGRNFQLDQSISAEHYRRVLSPINFLDQLVLQEQKINVKIHTWVITLYLFLRRRKVTLEMFWRFVRRLVRII